MRNQHQILGQGMIIFLIVPLSGCENGGKLSWNQQTK